VARRVNEDEAGQLELVGNALANLLRAHLDLSHRDERRTNLLRDTSRLRMENVRRNTT